MKPGVSVLSQAIDQKENCNCGMWDNIAQGQMIFNQFRPSFLKLKSLKLADIGRLLF